MDITIVATIILNGLVLGGVYLLVAVGLNIIFNLSRILNLAHGAFYTLGAYFSYTMLALGWNYFAALIVSPLLVALLALVIERPIIAPIRGRHLVYTLIITFGLMFVLEGLVHYFWGAQTRYIDLPEYMTQQLSIAGFYYSSYKIIVLILSLLIFVCLLIFLAKTRYGKILRAASRIPEMVSILGVNMRFIHIGTFVLGAFLAGAAGVIAGPLYTVYPDMGHQMLVISFVVLVIGGVGSLRGTVPAAFLVGFVQSLCEFFITELAMVIVFLTMAVVLAFMPRGLLREGRFE